MPLSAPPLLRRGCAAALVAAAAFLPAACAGGGFSPIALTRGADFSGLAKEPLDALPWAFGEDSGVQISTPHFRLYTTIGDPLYQRLLARVLEATHARMNRLNPQTAVPAAGNQLDCYVFHSRSQWESYTRQRAGSNAPIYLQISAGGYCQEGVFAGYDIGQEQTLSVVAHEAWHQYSWFAFRDRLPSWLEEGLATQNESMDWQGSTPVFRPANNWRRFSTIQKAAREGRLWKLPDLLGTHAGRVIKLSQGQIDTYYAQLWSLVLFLERSPEYAPKLQGLLADASAGKLTQALAGTGVTRREIDNFTERWNTVAGPVYAQKYFTPDLEKMEADYRAWLGAFTQAWPPRE